MNGGFEGVGQFISGLCWVVEEYSGLFGLGSIGDRKLELEIKE